MEKISCLFKTPVSLPKAAGGKNLVKILKKTCGILPEFSLGSGSTQAQSRFAPTNRETIAIQSMGPSAGKATHFSGTHEVHLPLRVQKLNPQTESSRKPSLGFDHTLPGLQSHTIEDLLSIQPKRS